MARPRVDLQRILENVVGVGHKVWFQAPTNTKLTYPCIMYTLSDKDVRKADNGMYKYMNQYECTYITRDPDDPVVDALLALEYCEFDRHYVSDNLNHYTFTIYY